jgi:integrase
MSVQRRRLASGRVGYIVRWREGSGTQRSRTFDRKRDARDFDADLRRRRRLGELDLLDAGRDTLDSFAAEWWRLHAEANLERSTRESYADLYDRHVLPRLGDVQLRELSAERLEQFIADLRAAGVGDATIRRALAIVQSMLSRAVVWRRIPTNPVAAIRKPTPRRKRVVRPLAPSSVEAIRAALLSKRRHRDATLIAVLAYAGLRPGEALALTWGDVREQTILVEKALALGEIKSTKNRVTRTVDLLAPLAADLRLWRMASGRPDERELVFPQTRSAGPWSDDAYRAWRRKTFATAVAAAKLEPMRPYDLRHSFASLLIAEGRSVLEVAEQLGHAPTMTLDVYGHVLAELAAQTKRPAADLIAEARERLAGGNGKGREASGTGCGMVAGAAWVVRMTD